MSIEGRLADKYNEGWLRAALGGQLEQQQCDPSSALYVCLMPSIAYPENREDIYVCIGGGDFSCPRTYKRFDCGVTDQAAAKLTCEEYRTLGLVEFQRLSNFPRQYEWKCNSVQLRVTCAVPPPQRVETGPVRAQSQESIVTYRAPALDIQRRLQIRIATPTRSPSR